MKPMTDAEWRSFLDEGTRTAKLATVRADGSPHVVPIWFLVDGDDVVFMTMRTSVKGKNLARDSRVTLCVDEETPPFAFVTIRGEARVADVSPEEMLDWSTRIARRYMGDAKAEDYGKRNAVPEEMVVRVAIRNVFARSGVAD